MMKMKTNSITVKAVLIAVLVLLMLIPVGMVKLLIYERYNNSQLVKEEIGKNWGGGKQQLTGVVMVLPYHTIDQSKRTVVNYAYFLPENYSVEGNVKPEERTRGIYKVVCYQTNLNLKGAFKFPDYEKLGLKSDQIQWDKAFLVTGVSYMQGIKNKVELNINGEKQHTLSATSKNHLQVKGLSFPFPLNAMDRKDVYNFDMNLVLNGAESLSVSPVGKDTQIRLTSDWNSVSFTGNFLPDKREISQTGFNAEWNIYSYNRNYSQMWIVENDELEESAIGVDLILPIDQYQMNMRSAKYAILFIALTFMVFFLVELISRKRIHPFQYLLVSFALVLFYCLLLAISEQIGFSWAYLASAVAVIVLITTYSKTIFNSLKQTIVMAVFLCVLYTFLYVLLQLEDMALMFGSIGLFVALAAVMYASRKVNWYKENED
jgi:inner membrane protein